jgi:hypothetical protein
MPLVPSTLVAFATSDVSHFPLELAFEHSESSHCPFSLDKQVKNVWAEAEADAKAPTTNIATTLTSINLNRDIDELSFLPHVTGAVFMVLARTYCPPKRAARWSSLMCLCRRPYPLSWAPLKDRSTMHDFGLAVKPSRCESVVCPHDKGL